MKELEPDCTLSRAADVLHREIADETVLVNLEEGRYYALNETGSAIWSLLEEPILAADLRDRLLDQYEVDADQLWQELSLLVGELVQLQLVEVVAPE
jgi:hypothetical protein